MIRTIKIWWLLCKLHADNLKYEVTQSEHAKKTGHAYSAYGTQIDFLEEVAKGDPEKIILYGKYLSIADKNMHLLKVMEEPMPCPDCGCHTGPPTSWIKLNDDGLEFIGIFNLVEYILSKYKLTWGLVATIFLSPIWVPLLSNYLFHPICVMISICHV